MSKPDAKAPQPAAKDPAAQEATATTANGGTPAMVLPASAPQATPVVTPDAHHGHGGLYTRSAGKRDLVDRTQAQHETIQEPK
ncbi:MAG: hypothetical protein ABI606_14240 [Rhodoferax sp.]